jgi:ribosomal protein S18 acetylase RimI-like enzyme
MDFTLRPITDADLPILFEIYASTRTGELAPVTWWDEAQKRAFLFQQFAAQHQYYLQHYINSSFDVVMVDEQIIGRLYVARWENQIRIIDIAFLPPHRGMGIGTQLLGRLLEESRTQNLPLTIHVERNNPALAWYHRLGFKMVEDKGVYFLLSAEKSSKD